MNNPLKKLLAFAALSFPFSGHSHEPSPLAVVRATGAPDYTKASEYQAIKSFEEFSQAIYTFVAKYPDSAARCIVEMLSNLKEEDFWTIKFAEDNQKAERAHVAIGISEKYVLALLAELKQEQPKAQMQDITPLIEAFTNASNHYLCMCSEPPHEQKVRKAILSSVASQLGFVKQIEKMTGSPVIPDDVEEGVNLKITELVKDLNAFRPVVQDVVMKSPGRENNQSLSVSR